MLIRKQGVDVTGVVVRNVGGDGSGGHRHSGIVSGVASSTLQTSFGKLRSGSVGGGVVRDGGGGGRVRGES